MTTLADTLKAKREELSLKYFKKSWDSLSEEEQSEVEITARLEVEGHYYV